MPTFGEHLVDAALPVEFRGRGPMTKGKLHAMLVEIAKKYPAEYPKIVSDLKRIGDEVSTLEGISVGLDDIAPDRAQRDGLLNPFAQKFHAAKGAEKEKILLAAQNSVLDYTKKHPGTMGEMVRSGGRGNAAQLMKIVGAPVLARDEKDRIVPWLIGRSYSEGLRPSEAWVAGNEARINSVKSSISVVEPGDLSKILVNNMTDKLITIADCGTTNGLSMRADDAHVIDRHLAHALTSPALAAGTLITPQVAQKISAHNETIVVRSPMTCLAPHGICQKCQGLDYTGKLHPVGTNVGMRAAQALSEPLTQFSLNAKHGGRIDTGGDTAKKLEGIGGVRQALEIPQSFLHRATLAEHDGQVTRVEDAPQGGRYAWVNETRHYITPGLGVLVKPNQRVEAGDALSEGVPKPDEIAKHKGLGEGRRYLVDTLHDIYRRAGADVDKRHLETLARSVMNHVYIVDTAEDHDHGFIKGDVVNYNRFVASLAHTQKNVLVADAEGKTLAENVLHFTAGTRITAAIKDTLVKRNIKNVNIATTAPSVAPMMRAASRTPLLNPDWMARLAHRYLKDTLLQGAHRGDVSNIHGPHPAPAYAAGTEFGAGSNGEY